MRVLKLPRLLLERRVGEPRTLTAYHIARYGGETSYTSALLSLLPNHTDGLTPEAVDVTKDYVLDLVALCLSRHPPDDRLSEPKLLPDGGNCKSESLPGVPACSNGR